MLNRTLILALVAMIAIVVGAAAGFFELTAVGVLAAIAAVAFGLRSRRTRQAPGR